MRRTWYDVKAAADGPAVISIYDDIGMWGVSAKDFITSLSTISSKAITLEINSPGGSVFDALAIFNALRNSGKDITVRVMGIAASAASYIAMVGTKITMPENTFMMVHNPLNEVYGNAADMREMADVLDKVGNSLIATYVARTGLSDAKVRDLLAKDSYLTAAECLELGFADEVTPAIKATAKFEREHLPENIQALFKAAENPDDPDAEDDAAESDDTADADVPVDDQPQDVAVPFATQIEVAAKAAGMGEYAAAWALDQRVSSLGILQDRIAAAREITALCAVTKQPAAAAKFISEGKSLAEARTSLSDALVGDDDNHRVDTTPQGSNKPIRGVQPSAVKTADIWAARHNSQLRSLK